MAINYTAANSELFRNCTAGYPKPVEAADRAHCGGAAKRLGDYNKSVEEQLQELLPGHNFIIVPRVTQLITGI